MSQSRTTIDHLKWSVIFLIAALLGGGFLGAASYRLAQNAELQHRNASREFGESQSRLTRAAQEAQELRDKIERFLVLQQQGFIGRESRLDWIEQIAQLAREHKLHDFQYEFSPQKAVDALLLPTGAAVGTHQFLVSAQHVSAKVLHEGDLLAFFADLRRSVKALVIVRQCHIERLPAPIGNALAPQLAVDCQLDWVSLQEAKP